MPNASLLQFTGLTSLLIVRRQLYAPVPLDLLFLFVNPLKFDRLFFIFWAFSLSIMICRTDWKQGLDSQPRPAGCRALGGVNLIPASNDMPYWFRLFFPYISQTSWYFWIMFFQNQFIQEKVWYVIYHYTLSKLIWPTRVGAGWKLQMFHLNLFASDAWKCK